MRTETCTRSHYSKSKYKKHIVITVEEANSIVDWEMSTVENLEALLKNASLRNSNANRG